MKKLNSRITLALILLICVILTGCNPNGCGLSGSDNGQVNSELTVHFIDVGQADCILIQNQNINALIDTGNRDDYDLIYDYLNSYDVKKIDYLVLTHPHEDHIGSAGKIVKTFDIGEVFMTDLKADSNVYSFLLKSLKEKSLDYKIPKVGDRISVGECEMTFLGPVKKYEDANEMSLVVRAVFGDTSFLFTGDAGSTSEKDILNSKAVLESDVLKVGHHGSSTSSSYVFLKAVNPVEAIIMCGKGNDYGHPHEEALSRLHDVGATLYRTDELGNVVARSDGKKVTFDQKGTESSRLHVGMGNGLGSSVKKDIDVSDSSDRSEEHEVIYSQYVGNKNSKKFHSPDCSSLPKEENRVYFDSRDEAVEAGYESCGLCKP